MPRPIAGVQSRLALAGTRSVGQLTSSDTCIPEYDLFIKRGRQPKYKLQMISYVVKKKKPWSPRMHFVRDILSRGQRILTKGRIGVLSPLARA